LFAELTAAAAFEATIHTNSWHENISGRNNAVVYDQFARDVDRFVWEHEEQLVLGSLGNIDEEQGPPGTAKNAIGINATHATPHAMRFADGNPGPTAEGRRKPDISSPGCGLYDESSFCKIYSSEQSSPTNSAFTQCGDCRTSYATPHVAAAAALVRQYYIEGWYPFGQPWSCQTLNPSGALLKATLVNSTLDMSEVAGYPSDTEGWGLLRLDESLFFPDDTRRLRVWDISAIEGLDTGETHSYQLEVGSSSEPLKITLVWTEPPGAASASTPVVNNLDLKVTAPSSGTEIFLGNIFEHQQSVIGGSADAVNNVETVLISNPAPGVWNIEVSGTVVNRVKPENSQGYALVANGDFSAFHENFCNASPTPREEICP
jgi:hypothetical protein